MTEAEVQMGILDVQDGVNDAALCFNRELKNIDLNNALASTYDFLLFNW